jgi:hypothetical protein
LGSYYRYGPRKVAELCDDTDNKVYVAVPKIHQSVFERIDGGGDAYAPIGLPAHYVIATDQGCLAAPSAETAAQAAARATAQDRIWNFVWLRRIVYFLTLFGTFHIAAFWLFHPLVPSYEFSSPIRLVSEAVRLAAAILPSSLHWWFDYYAGNPGWFAGGLAAIVVLSSCGSQLSARISDLMRIVWGSKASIDPVPHNHIQDFIFSFRTNVLCQKIVWLSRMHILPFLFFLAVIYLGLVFSSHLIFNVADSMGAFCQGDEKNSVPVNKGVDQMSTFTFDTRAICGRTGLKVKEGFDYATTVQIDQPWDDAGFPTTPVGYHTSQQSGLTRLALYLGIPLRRVMFRPWFRLIARVGEEGVDEYSLDPLLKKGNGEPANTYTARIKADRDGELFLYVNDAVVGLPWLHSVFFTSNNGTAKISVSLL